MKHVMIVEDNPDHAWILQLQLNKLRFLSSACLDPFMIIEKVKKGLVDAITVDISMPVINGIDLIKMIRKVDKKVRIVVITSQVFDDTRIRSLQAGADYFITKPYDMNELKAVLHDIKD